MQLKAMLIWYSGIPLTRWDSLWVLHQYQLLWWVKLQCGKCWKLRLCVNQPSLQSPFQRVGGDGRGHLHSHGCWLFWKWCRRSMLTTVMPISAIWQLLGREHLSWVPKLLAGACDQWPAESFDYKGIDGFYSHHRWGIMPPFQAEHSYVCLWIVNLGQMLSIIWICWGECVKLLHLFHTLMHLQWL